MVSICVLIKPLCKTKQIYVRNPYECFFSPTCSSLSRKSVLPNASSRDLAAILKREKC